MATDRKRRLLRKRVRERERQPRRALMNLGSSLIALGILAIALGIIGWPEITPAVYPHRAAGGSLFLVLTGLFLTVLGILRVRQGMKADDA